jgi:IS4 transposase
MDNPVPFMVGLTGISKRLTEMSDDYKRRAAVAERIRLQLTSRETALVTHAEQLLVQEKAQAILVKLEEVWRKDFERGIEQVVTEGLELVFGRGSDFFIDTQVKGGASSITFDIETPEVRCEIQESQGGSLVQVVSFLLREILVKAATPPMRQTILLDEAFEGVHAENVPLVALLVSKMVEDSGIQIIMVTQNPVYTEYADAVYDITKKLGVASARRV